MSSSKSRKEEILTHINNIEKSVVRKRQNILKPTRSDIDKAIKIILDYIKQNKRIIYGGTAQNMHIISINKSQSFYNDLKIPDIDFYSPEPMYDLVAISDKLHESKLGYIYAKDAQHEETFTIFYETMNVVDITYMPRIIYNGMPYSIFDGIRYTAPEFFFIDLYRIYTDPLTSYVLGNTSRIKKVYNRMIILEEMFQKDCANDECSFPGTNSIVTVIDDILKIIMTKKEFECIIVGDFAYNQFVVKECECAEYSMPVKSLDIIAPDIKKIAMLILALIKKNYPDSFDNVRVKEYNPYFQFIGNRITISIGNTLIANIIFSQEKCLPYKQIDSGKYKGVLIGSYHMFLLYQYIFISIERTHNKNARGKTNKLYCMINQAYKAREKYLEKCKKLGIEKNNLYQELQVECIGKTEDPRRKHFIEMPKKKHFSYNPDKSMNKNKKKQLKEFKGFANTSGNEITNDKKLLIKPKFIQDLRNKV